MLTHFLQFEFLRLAAITGLLSSVLAGLVGPFVVTRQLVSIAGGLAHAAFAGLGVAFYLGIDPRIGALTVALIGALLVETWSHRTTGHEPFIGVLWSVGMAVGILFLALVPGYVPDLMSFLFGNILTVTQSDAWILAAATFLTAAFVSLFWKELVAISFDEDFARTQGVPVRALRTALVCLIAVTVVLLIDIVGIVLVLALLTIPSLIALRLSHRFLPVIALATVVGLSMVLSGLLLSYEFDLPTGPTIVLIGAVLLGALFLLGHRPRRVASATAADYDQRVANHQ